MPITECHFSDKKKSLSKKITIGSATLMLLGCKSLTKQWFFHSGMHVAKHFVAAKLQLTNISPERDNMKNIMKSVIAGVVLTASMSTANAAVIQLGSINKTYNSSSLASSMTAGTCDTASATSVNVTDNSSCQRFFDLFDFSSLNYTSLDHLTLTLTFGATNNLFENWKVRFADSTTHGSATLLDMNNVTGNTIQSFTLTSAQADVFSQIAANEKMYLWFAEEGLGRHNFNLSAARLDVFGTAVPEPASMALFGIALGALGLSRRKKR